MEVAGQQIRDACESARKKYSTPNVFVRAGYTQTLRVSTMGAH